MTKRMAMFSYRNEVTRREEHVAVHRVVGFKNGDWSRTYVEIDYGDSIRPVESSESLAVLKERWERLMETIDV